EINRQGSRLTVSRRLHDNSPLNLSLSIPSDITMHNTFIRESFRNASLKYPTFVDHLGPRKKMTIGLMFLLSVQETFFLFYKRIRGIRSIALRILSGSTWIVIAIVLLSFESIVQIYTQIIEF